MKRKVVLVVILLFALAGVALLVNNQKSSPTITTTQPSLSPQISTALSPTSQPAVSSQQVQVAGVITNVAQSARPNVLLVTVRDATQNTSHVEINAQTKIYDESNRPEFSSYLKKTFTIQAKGTPTEGAIAATEVRVTKAPNIILTTPTEQSTVKRAFSISGEARVFENTLQVRVTNKRTNQKIVSQTVMANAQDTGSFGSFSYSVTLPANTVQSGDQLLVDAFQNSAKDGSEIDNASVVVLFRE